MKNVNIAKSIRGLMGYKGIKQKELAFMLGISPAALSMKIRGTVKFQIDDLILLSEYFDVSIDELLKGDKNE